MSWLDIPFSHVSFGLFVGSSAGASVTVAPADLKLCRYRLIDKVGAFGQIAFEVTHKS